jgi:hypothetical protein
VETRQLPVEVVANVEITVLALQIRTVEVPSHKSVEIAASVDPVASVLTFACVWALLKSTNQHLTLKLMPGSME